MFFADSGVSPAEFAATVNIGALKPVSCIDKKVLFVTRGHLPVAVVMAAYEQVVKTTNLFAFAYGNRNLHCRVAAGNDVIRMMLKAARHILSIDARIWSIQCSRISAVGVAAQINSSQFPIDRGTVTIIEKSGRTVGTRGEKPELTKSAVLTPDKDLQTDRFPGPRPRSS